MLDPYVCMCALVPVLFLALYGFISLLLRFSRPIDGRFTQPRPGDSINQDVFATCLMLNRLRLSGELSHERYVELRELLESKHPYPSDLPLRVQDAGAGQIVAAAPTGAGHSPPVVNRKQVWQVHRTIRRSLELRHIGVLSKRQASPMSIDAQTFIALEWYCSNCLLVNDRFVETKRCCFDKSRTMNLIHLDH